MKKREALTDEQVEKEIEQLKKNPHVQLAQKKQRVDYRRRQYLYTLRNYEKRGKELAAAGITMEMLDEMDCEE